MCVAEMDTAKQYIDASTYLSQLRKGRFDFYYILSYNWEAQGYKQCCIRYSVLSNGVLLSTEYTEETITEY